MSAFVASSSSKDTSSSSDPSPSILFHPKSIANYKRSDLIVTIDDRVAVELPSSSASSNGQKSKQIAFGTVRFIGPILSKSKNGGIGPWHGIELEEAIGKNDGNHDKMEYFRCGPKKGIFVKRSKIQFVDTPNPNGPRLTVGDTVNIDGGKMRGKAMVRYLGIPSFKRLYHEGNWYGVEMDTVSGRHHGVVGGVTYFECDSSDGRGRGLFVTADLISLRSDTLQSISSGDGSEHKMESIELVEIPTLCVSRGRSESASSSKHRRRRRPRSNTVDRTQKGSSSKSSRSSRYLMKRKKFDDSANRRYGNSLHLKSSSNHSDREMINGQSLNDLVIEEDKATNNKFDDDDDDKNESKEMESKMERKQYEKRYIITESGYSVSFLLSDKRLNVQVLRSQVLHTFGHIEPLEAEQIEIKIVDKMCVLVRVTFHRRKSFEKAIGWKFWWKKKSHSLKGHEFKKWRKLIEVKEVYPIHFCYSKALGLSKEDIKKFVIGYLNHLEELLQNKEQIQFEDETKDLNDDDDDENGDDDGNGERIKCIIYFANRRARDQLFRSKFIDLSFVADSEEKVECALVVDTDSIPC